MEEQDAGTKCEGGAQEQAQDVGADSLTLEELKLAARTALAGLAAQAPTATYRAEAAKSLALLATEEAREERAREQS